MAVSSITKHRTSVSARLGTEIRRRRRAQGLSQAQLGAPFTRSFVSAVEHGRCLPSLPVLALFADRLGASPADLLEAVKHDLATLYTGVDAQDRGAARQP